MNWRIPVLALFLGALPEAVPADATEATVYAYDDAVTTMVDVDKFEKSGDVTFLAGTGESCMTEPGPASAPYPQIRFLGPCFEQLGDTDADTDGISFYTRGNQGYLKKNGQVFVVWDIRIPSANKRSAADFDEDLTLSMWVDWDQNGAWDRDELAVRKTFNIRQYLPTGKEDIYLHYLTTFRVPDIARAASMTAGPGKDHGRELTYLWVRGSLSYDNPLVSPDGDQLYGEFEDHRVGYRSNADKNRTNGADN